ncbi:MAG TPA: flap endonuclease, partial [Ilumatobacteraceae bacterium]|nr:flap endonuclease [Ilumatobacteraceae bacterium]
MPGPNSSATQPPTTGIRVHLVDGTYELFRQHYGQMSHRGDAGPYAATVGVLASTLQLLSGGANHAAATHVGVASDHVIESFRNDLWPGYKTSAGMDPDLLAQIPVVEDALEAMGITTWRMVSHEADDALGAAAALADADPQVEQALIVTPDKDLGQCVRGQRVVQYDRRKDEIIDEAAVRAKFGVGPDLIADYLGLVGDTADGFPGLPG